MTAPGIDLLAAPDGARDLILLAHGGMENSTATPHSWRAPILRMWPFAAAARKAAPGAAVGLMRYRYQGWNGPAADPATDLHTVLNRLTSPPPSTAPNPPPTSPASGATPRSPAPGATPTSPASGAAPASAAAGTVPPARFERVVLIGHSMGGRAVVAAGNHPLVAGVLGLAPWLPEGEPLVHLRGPVVFAHGTADRITSPAATASYARRLRTAGIPVALLSVEGEKHAMLRRAPDWNELVRRFVRHALTPTPCPLLTTTHQTNPLPTWHPKSTTPQAVAEIATTRLHLRRTTHL